MSDDLAAICDRLALKLCDGRLDRDGLIDMATVLLFLCYRLGRAVDELELLQGPNRRTEMVRLAIGACSDRLHGLRHCAVYAEIARTVASALHVVVAALVVLENARSRVELPGL